MTSTKTIDPAKVCVHPPCRGPRKCWQYDYCWYYGEPIETLPDTGNGEELMDALRVRHRMSIGKVASMVGKRS